MSGRGLLVLMIECLGMLILLTVGILGAVVDWRYLLIWPAFFLIALVVALVQRIRSKDADDDSVVE